MKEHHGIWAKEFIMVFMMSLFSSTAAYMTYPLITQYALSIKNDIGLASTIAGLMSLMGLLISPFAGMITDSFNIKKVLQCSYLFYVFILLSHILATNIPLLVIMRLLVGISFAVNSVAGTVFSTHFIVRERMAEGLGYAALANILAQAIGPGLGLYLVELSGYSLTFFAAAMCAAVSLLIVTLLPYMQEKRPHFSFHKISFTDLIALEYADFMLIAALLSISSSWVTTYLSLIAIERNIVNVGLFFTFYSAFMAFVRPMFGTLHDQRGIYTVMLPAIFCESLAIFMIGNATSLLLILASSLFKAVGQGAGSPALQAEVIKRMDKNKSGVAASTVLIGMHIGNAFGPMLGGVFVKDLGFTKMFSGFAVLSLILNFILLSLRYRKDKATS